jgi:hypothetical protein
VNADHAATGPKKKAFATDVATTDPTAMFLMVMTMAVAARSEIRTASGPVRTRSLSFAVSRDAARSSAYAAAMFSETRYALNGDLRVAYRASSEGSRDIVFVPNWFFCNKDFVGDLPTTTDRPVGSAVTTATSRRYA